MHACTHAFAFANLQCHITLHCLHYLLSTLFLSANSLSLCLPLHSSSKTMHRINTLLRIFRKRMHWHCVVPVATPVPVLYSGRTQCTCTCRVCVAVGNIDRCVVWQLLLEQLALCKRHETPMDPIPVHMLSRTHSAFFEFSLLFHATPMAF